MNNHIFFNELKIKIMIRPKKENVSFPVTRDIVGNFC